MPFINYIKLETRALNIQGTLNVHAVVGKGVNNGWDKIKNGLLALGFQLSSDEEPIPPVQKRDRFLLILSQMPEESFGWIVASLIPNAGRAGHSQIFPDGMGGFQSASQKSVEALQKEALRLAGGPDANKPRM